MAHAFSHVSHALSLCHRPFLIHLPVSGITCRLWDIHLAEQREDRPVESLMFSEDGSLLAIIQSRTLCMWKTSAWELLWSVPCEGLYIFSHDGLQVRIADRILKAHAHDARSGDALGEVHYTPDSVHDHVHISNEEVRQCRTCESSRLENGEFWFTESDRWLWVVEERVARRLIHIHEYFYDIKAHSGYVAVQTLTGPLVLNTACNSEAV